MTRRRGSVFLGVSMLLCALSVPTSLMAQDEVCAGFDGSKRIVTFGANAISSERAENFEDLQGLMTLHREELEGILRDRGLGHLIDEVVAAITTGEGVSERNLVRGETFAWMASRKDGVARSGGPVCIATTSTEEAWEVVVTEETRAPVVATCSLNVTSDCAAGTLSVDASGSSAGVEVSMSGGGRSTSILTGGSKTWTGSFDDRYASDYSFTATAPGSGTVTTTTHTFVIPKVCLNLSYKGEPKVATTALAATSCTETAEVQSCDAAAAACSIELAETRTRSKGSLDVDVSGHWDASNDDGILVIATDHSGATVASLRSFPTTISFPRPGTYTLDGTAINEAGESRTCTAEVEVDPRYTVRGYGLVGYPADDKLVVPGNDGTPAGAGLLGLQGGETLTQMKLHSGLGLGADFEYHFNRRIGLNASLQFVQFDTSGMFDSCCVWEMGDEDTLYTALTVGPNFHLTPDSDRFDFYVGPFIGIADVDDVEYDFPSGKARFEMGSEFVWGGLVGLDYDLGDLGGWFLHFGARYVDLEFDGFGPESEDDELEDFSDIDFSPTIFEFGVAKKW